MSKIYFPKSVVSYLASTSNHNETQRYSAVDQLFLILHLHQTTTAIWLIWPKVLLFLILHLHQTTTVDPNTYPIRCCFLSCIYIKPQPVLSAYSPIVLFLILHLHQTTTILVTLIRFIWLFLILHLHQTTTVRSHLRPQTELFLILHLHQTTTSGENSFSASCCFLSCIYIKPQHKRW